MTRSAVRFGSALVSLAVAFGMTTAGFAASENPSAQPVKIAFITSLSGASGKDGPQMVNGFKLFLDQHGNKMAGRPVELVLENDESTPATGTSPNCAKSSSRTKSILHPASSWRT